MTAPAEHRVVAAGIAHDANNMLMVVLACADHLLQQRPKSSAADAILLDLHAAATRASALIRQLVASEPTAPRDERIAIDDALAGIDGMLRVLAGPRIALEMSPNAAGASVRCGRDRLENLVVNLVSNACDATSREGRVEVGTVNVDCANGPHVMLSVRDTGAGMDEATRARVFDPFFTTKAQGRGAGLGLTVVRRTVSELGGAIELETAPGQGTTVRVYLPRETELLGG